MYGKCVQRISYRGGGGGDDDDEAVSLSKKLTLEQVSRRTRVTKESVPPRTDRRCWILLARYCGERAQTGNEPKTLYCKSHL